VKCLLALMLLLGALTGLLGAQTAYALGFDRTMLTMAEGSPTTANHVMAAMDRAEMDMSAMPKAPAHAPTQPCKGMTLACIAAMGCIVPLVTPSDAPMLARHIASSSRLFAPAVAPLVGRSVGPEPEPPSPLI
jgi:hypothetical protein